MYEASSLSVFHEARSAGSSAPSGATRGAGGRGRGRRHGVASRAALLALVSLPPVLADGRAPTLLALATVPPVLADAPAPALLALASPPPMLADARAPAPCTCFAASRARRSQNPRTLHLLRRLPCSQIPLPGHSLQRYPPHPTPCTHLSPLVCTPAERGRFPRAGAMAARAVGCDARSRRRAPGDAETFSGVPDSQTTTLPYRYFVQR